MAAVAAAQRTAFPRVGLPSASPFLRRNLRVPIYDTSGCSQSEAGRFYALLLRDVKSGRELLGVFLSLGRHLYPYAFCRAVLETALQRHSIDLEMDWTEVQVTQMPSGARHYYMLGQDSLRERSDLDLDSEVSEAACVLLHVFCAAWLAADDTDLSLGLSEVDEDDDEDVEDGRYEFPMPSVCWSVLGHIRKSITPNHDDESHATSTDPKGCHRLDGHVDEDKSKALKTSNKAADSSGGHGDKTPKEGKDGQATRPGRAGTSEDLWRGVARETWELLPLEAVGRAFAKLVARGEALAFLLRRNLLLASLRGDWRAAPYAAVYDLVWHADVKRMTRENCRALGLCPRPEVILDSAEPDTDASDEVTPEDSRLDETANSKDSGDSPRAEPRRPLPEEPVDQSPDASPGHPSQAAPSPVYDRQEPVYLPVFSDPEDESPGKLETSSTRKRVGRRRRRKGRKQSSAEAGVFRDVSPSPSVSSAEKCSKVSKSSSPRLGDRSSMEASKSSSCRLEQRSTMKESSSLEQRSSTEASPATKGAAEGACQTAPSETAEGSPAKSKASRRSGFKRRNRRSRASTSPNENVEKESGKARSGKAKSRRRKTASKNGSTSQNGAEVTSPKDQVTSPQAAETKRGQGNFRADLDRELAAALNSAPRTREEVDSVPGGEARARDKPRRWSKARAHTSRNLLSLEAEGAKRQI